jgi:hypothetical protein
LLGNEKLGKKYADRAYTKLLNYNYNRSKRRFNKLLKAIQDRG